jgi:hypothetical protein
MMHPSDAEIVMNLLQVTSIPKELDDEYAIWQRMYHGGGASGALRIQMLVPLLRQMGYKPPEPVKVEQVEWRKHIGGPIVAKYGDQDIIGTLAGFGPHGTLVVKLEGYTGEIELPKHCVRLEL